MEELVRCKFKDTGLRFLLLATGGGEIFQEAVKGICK
jgi:hypothetical protein